MASDELKKGIKNIGKGIGQLGKGLGDAAADIGKQAGDIAKDAGRTAEKLTKDIGEKAKPVMGEVEKAANKIAEDIDEKLPQPAKEQIEKAKAGIDAATQSKEEREKLDAELQSAIEGYNLINNNLTENAKELFNNRERAVDLISHVEDLVNSIANTPKEFEKDIAEIQINKAEFKEVCDFAAKELELAKEAAAGGGAGVAGGVAVASLAPTAAMWVATTFGTASTGVAISTLTGAAAESAALAWLGGGAIAAGGGGTVAGSALLALAGPIGWGIAGTAVLTSGVIFASKRLKMQEEKKNEIEYVISNTEILKEKLADLDALLKKTVYHRDKLNQQYSECMPAYSKDYNDLDEDAKLKLGAMVNNAKSLAATLKENIEA